MSMWLSGANALAAAPMLWLSGANAVLGSARSHHAEAKRQAATMMSQGAKQMARFWSGAWMAPSGEEIPIRRSTDSLYTQPGASVSSYDSESDKQKNFVAAAGYGQRVASDSDISLKETLPMATSAKRTARSSKQDAIAMLTADHKKVKSIFKKFEKLKKQDSGDAEKAELVQEACMALTVHAQLEEEIFYPAVREGTEEDDLMDEAQVEHMSAKAFIAELQSMQPGDELYEAKFTVLGEYVNHHVEEEEGELFHKAKRAKIDTAALGEQMMQRKQALLAEHGVAEESTPRARPAKKSGRR
jgi:hypothetical protein